jgi:hypothetical protein
MKPSGLPDQPNPLAVYEFPFHFFRKESIQMKSNIINIKTIVETVTTEGKTHKSIKKSEFDFLKEANELLEESQIATGGKGQTLGMDAEQLETFEHAIGQLEEKAPVYLPLVVQLLEKAKPFRDLGAVMLMAFDWDEYCVEPTTAPTCSDADDIYERVLEQVGDTPFDWNFNVAQVFYAFRLEAKGDPVCVYALQYTGQKLLYLLLDGQWHKFPGIDDLVDLAVDRSVSGDDWQNLKSADDFIFNHEEMVKACRKSALLTQSLKEWEERSALAQQASQRAVELSV